MLNKQEKEIKLKYYPNNQISDRRIKATVKAINRINELRKIYKNK